MRTGGHQDRLDGLPAFGPCWGEAHHVGDRTVDAEFDLRDGGVTGGARPGHSTRETMGDDRWPAASCQSGDAAGPSDDRPGVARAGPPPADSASPDPSAPAQVPTLPAGAGTGGSSWSDPGGGADGGDVDGPRTGPRIGPRTGTADVTPATADVVVTWARGANTVVDGFDPARHTIFVDWIGADALEVSETGLGAVFAIPANRQSTTLAGVALADLSAANFTILDATAESEILAAIGDGAGAGHGATGSGEGGGGGEGGGDAHPRAAVTPDGRPRPPGQL
jgi:hypothetical protein